MKKNLKKGFTLIELLVVIAIIGILASVVVAALNSARSKGVDGGIKSALGNSRSQAELFYSANISYAGVCTTNSSATPGGVQNIILNAAQKLGSGTTVEGAGQAFVYNANGVAANLGDAVCHDNAAGWAAIVSMKTPVTASSGWCVDSTSQAKETTVLGANSVICGQ